MSGEAIPVPVITLTGKPENYSQRQFSVTGAAFCLRNRARPFLVEHTFRQQPAFPAHGMVLRFPVFPESHCQTGPHSRLPYPGGGETFAGVPFF